MTNYVYIQNLFTKILESSKAIQGRFHVGHRYALQDANYDTLGEVVNSIKSAKKYPLVIMAPPSSTSKFTGKREGWETFRIVLFFVKTTFYGEGANLDTNTRTSQHSVLQDWHDMKRCAINFMKVLVEAQRNTLPPVFAVPQHILLCTPFSEVGADRTSGVHINFDFDLYTGCELEDYDEYPELLNIPLDGHDEHKL